MSSAFYYISLFENQNLISILYCLQSVCDDDYCFSDEKIMKRYVYLILIKAIERARWLIQKYDIRIFQHYLGDR
jgi:hypothetical protein